MHGGRVANAPDCWSIRLGRQMYCEPLGIAPAGACRMPAATLVAGDRIQTFIDDRIPTAAPACHATLLDVVLLPGLRPSERVEGSSSTMFQPRPDGPEGDFYDFLSTLIGSDDADSPSTEYVGVPESALVPPQTSGQPIPSYSASLSDRENPRLRWSGTCAISSDIAHNP